MSKMALDIFMEHSDYFKDWSVLDKEWRDFNDGNVVENNPYSRRMTHTKDGMRQVMQQLNPRHSRIVLDELTPWRFQILKKIFPSIKRIHSNLQLRQLNLRDKFVSSFWCWQLLTKPLDGYYFKMDIKKRIVDQGVNPVNIICTAAEENYFAVCTTDRVFIYRIDNIKSPIYQTEFGLGSTIKSIYFYQSESGHLIAIVCLRNNRLRFIDVKYRRKIHYPAIGDVEFSTICVGTHHRFFTEKANKITEYELKSTTNTGHRNAIGRRNSNLSSKAVNLDVAYMASESNKLFVAGDFGNSGYVVMILDTPLPEQVALENIPKVRIDLLKNTRDEISQIFIPIDKMIISNADGRIKFGRWTDFPNGIMEKRMENPSVLQHRPIDDHHLVKVTSYTIHADILFIGYENGFLQIFRINDKRKDEKNSDEENGPNLDKDESKSIKLSKDQPITAICVSELKETLFIVASTARHFYLIKFTF